MQFFQSIGKFRLRYLFILCAIFLILAFLVRLALGIAFPDALPVTQDTANAAGSLLKGLVNDLAALSYALLLPAALLLLPTDRFLRGTVGRVYSFAILCIFSGIFVFSAFAEYFFWEEFSSRFNFITVDYLIYTTELVNNILESYPMHWLFAVIALLTVMISLVGWRLARHACGKTAAHSLPRVRLLTLTGLFAVAGIFFVFFTPLGGSPNRFWNEYAKNGVYELFSAYWHNQLDYRSFYLTMKDEDASAIMQQTVGSTVMRQQAPNGIATARLVQNGASAQSPNVILVIMESMGQRRLGENTPNLNQLAASGLSFSRMMSTGTRTVRGIEAIMLSIPPTPGNSIVRRADNDGLFTLGTQFRLRGYDQHFIYGGIGFFDNMNAFFAGNGYITVDRFDFDAENKTFANAWGQCDEDLYAQSLSLADKSHAAGKPFQQVLLTTSNHRPFTYPDEKFTLPSGQSGQGSRQGAIRYADYAIGEFMRQAKTKPWFDNTIFIFVGDHPSSVAGKTELPANDYGIVCIMYGPAFFPAQSVSTLCSQLDVAPTLLARLGWDYPSIFFGQNALEIPQENGRAWISTYQLLGYRTNEALVVLRPDGSATVRDLNTDSVESMTAPVHELVRKAVASYQYAYDLYTGRQMKEERVLALRLSPRQIVPMRAESPGCSENTATQAGEPRKHADSKQVRALLRTYALFATGLGSLQAVK